jgi:hypothetical protein
LKVGRIKALGEPAVDRRENVARFGMTALVAVEQGEAHRSAQFPTFGPLFLGNVERLAIQFLRRREESNRFNRRYDLAAMIPRLCRSPNPPMPYRLLKLAENYA